MTLLLSIQLQGTSLSAQQPAHKVVNVVEIPENTDQGVKHVNLRRPPWQYEIRPRRSESKAMVAYPTREIRPSARVISTLAPIQGIDSQGTHKCLATTRDLVRGYALISAGTVFCLLQQRTDDKCEP
ncbi:hypothetical protein CC80DRAFT_555455 [Byssothecium circinans]|uniref:Uncharacterized protein n=1 Tax=Byssothecium circinans TaxID=147558 RepID=A0A6A5TJX2_9PLEO|nr:hypothetical protein CC80DRAFT_555455 [Byssothecium circinans]